MQDFVFHNPTKIIFGRESMNSIAEEIKPFGKKVLLTYGGGSIKSNGIYNKVMQQLQGFEVKEFSGIEPNPRVETIRKCVEQFRDFKPDFVLAVGGGSVIDATKLIVSAMHYDGDAWDFLIKPDTESAHYIPFGVVLTLSATCSEMNSGAVITNWEKNEKLFFTREQNYPKFSILNPENTFTVSREQTAYGIIDAFSHVLEQYITTAENVPLQDRFSEGLLHTLIENSKIALDNPTNYEARANIMLSATMALNGLISMGTAEDWATHNIEHEISAFYDIPHAAGLAIITPRWMKVTRSQKLKKLAHYGRRIWDLEGEDEMVSVQAIDKTYDFFKSLGVKMSLTEWNIEDKNFGIMIDRLVKTGIGEFALNKDQVTQILINCL